MVPSNPNNSHSGLQDHLQASPTAWQTREDPLCHENIVWGTQAEKPRANLGQRPHSLVTPPMAALTACESPRKD